MSLSPQHFRYWAVVQDDPNNPMSEWTAKCRCGWSTRWATYVRARTACMYHYYVCPKRWEPFDEEDE